MDIGGASDIERGWTKRFEDENPSFRAESLAAIAKSRAATDDS